MCRFNVNASIAIEDQDAAISVVRLEPSQEERLAGVLTVAFHNEPNFKYMIPAEEERLRLLPRFFQATICAAVRYGETYTTPSVDGGALWIRPETDLSPWRIVRTGFPSIPIQWGWANFRRWVAVETRLEEIRSRLAPESHWYLMALGVEPSMQRKRVGARLIEPVLSQADSSDLPCYLETFNEKNLGFYKRQGFRIAAAGNIPGGGPDFWTMIREPQSL